MRWAFWRKGRSGNEPGPLPASTWPPPGAAAPNPPAWVDEADGVDDPRRPTPAFSGASPDPGSATHSVLPGEGSDDLRGPLSQVCDDPSLDLPGVRADLVALVDAALARDPAAAAEVLCRLDARGPDEPGVASIAAMAVLGERCAKAADVPSGALDQAGAVWAEVVAQGDTVAGRAQPLLRAVAPNASRALVRSVVRTACGLPDQDAGLAPLMEAPSEDLALVVAVLLAQTVLDGGGDTQVLARELVDVLPG